MSWLPIETAPKDRRILVWTGTAQYAAHWGTKLETGDEAWIVAEWGDAGDQLLVKAVLWQPLPDSPPPCVQGVANAEGGSPPAQS